MLRSSACDRNGVSSGISRCFFSLFLIRKMKARLFYFEMADKSGNNNTHTKMEYFNIAAEISVIKSVWKMRPFDPTRKIIGSWFIAWAVFSLNWLVNEIVSLYCNRQNKQCIINSIKMFELHDKNQKFCGHQYKICMQRCWSSVSLCIVLSLFVIFASNSLPISVYLFVCLFIYLYRSQYRSLSLHIKSTSAYEHIENATANGKCLDTAWNSALLNTEAGLEILQK